MRRRCGRVNDLSFTWHFSSVSTKRTKLSTRTRWRKCGAKIQSSLGKCNQNAIEMAIWCFVGEDFEAVLTKRRAVWNILWSNFETKETVIRYGASAKKFFHQNAIRLTIRSNIQRKFCQRESKGIVWKFTTLSVKKWNSLVRRPEFHHRLLDKIHYNQLVCLHGRTELQLKKVKLVKVQKCRRSCTKVCTGKRKIQYAKKNGHFWWFSYLGTREKVSRKQTLEQYRLCHRKLHTAGGLMWRL